MGGEAIILLFLCSQAFDFYRHMHQNQSGPPGAERDFFIHSQAVRQTGSRHIFVRAIEPEVLLADDADGHPFFPGHGRKVRQEPA